MYKLAKILGIVVSVIGVILLFAVLFTNGEAFKDTQHEGFNTAQAIITTFITLAIVTLGILCLLLIGLSLKHIAAHPKQVKSIMFAAIGLLVLFGISFVLAGSDPVTVRMDGVDKVFDGTFVRMVGTGIIATIIMVVFTFGAWIFSGVSKSIK